MARTATFLEDAPMETPTRAAVAKLGQRRQIQGLISQEFPGSNPGRRTPCDGRGSRAVVQQLRRRGRLPFPLPPEQEVSHHQEDGEDDQPDREVEEALDRRG